MLPYGRVSAAISASSLCPSECTASRVELRVSPSAPEQAKLRPGNFGLFTCTAATTLHKIFAMSRSVHTSRPKFRKAFACDYSTEEERTRVLGKIIDEAGLRQAMKANARNKKQSRKAGVKPASIYQEHRAAASKTSEPTDEAKELVQRHNKTGYG